MGVVMIKCPRTGADISTGLKAEKESFGRMPVFMARCYCGHCRTEHEWFARDAWVAVENNSNARPHAA